MVKNCLKFISVSTKDYMYDRNSCSSYSSFLFPISPLSTAKSLAYQAKEELTIAIANLCEKFGCDQEMAINSIQQAFTSLERNESVCSNKESTTSSSESVSQIFTPIKKGMC